MERLVFGDLSRKERWVEEERFRAERERRIMAARDGLRATGWCGGRPDVIVAYPRHLRHYGLEILRAAALRLASGPPCRRCDSPTQEDCTCE